MATYFDNADLIELRKAEKKILKTVIYHNWQNKFVADDTFEFLDKLELIFTDEQKLILSASEDKVPGIIVVLDFDAKKTSYYYCINLVEKLTTKRKTSLRIHYGNYALGKNSSQLK